MKVHAKKVQKCVEPSYFYWGIYPLIIPFHNSKDMVEIWSLNGV